MPTGITVKVEDTELLRDLKKMGVDVNEVLEAALAAGAKIIEDEANRRAPGPHITTGDFKKRGMSAEISVGPDDDHWYYRFFETGATPHGISGNRLLRFLVGGDEVFARHVSHPGMAAKPFLRPAADENENQTRDAIGDKLKKALK